MNFNRNSKRNDYNLKANQIHEMIDLYGVEADYLYVQKNNIDNVLKDFSHLSLGENESRKVMLLPENSDEFDGSQSFSMWGLDNLRTLNLFISRKSLLKLYPDFDDEKGYSGILNSLLVFESGSIQEITFIEPQVPGINNVFLSDEDKSSYLLTTRAYSQSKQNDIKEEPEEVVMDEMEDIDSYFKSLDDKKEVIETEADTKSNTDSVFGSLS